MFPLDAGRKLKVNSECIQEVSRAAIFFTKPKECRKSGFELSINVVISESFTKINNNNLLSDRDPSLFLEI